MISVPSVSIKGVAGEKVKLPELIFGSAINQRLATQAVKVYLGNQRQSSAKTKTRGEIKKTTAKMYRQKGTGRARHGAYSAPIFVGGGVAHGPDGRQNYKRRMSSVQARMALFGSLSAKVKSDLVIIKGSNNLDKTREAGKLTEKISERGKKLLVILATNQTGAYRAFRNLNGVSVLFANQLNTYTVLLHKKLAISTEAVDELAKIFEKK